MAKSSRSKINYGGIPSVDLLPDAQRAALKHDRTMPKLLLAIFLSAVVAGGIWMAGTWPTGVANARLADAETESHTLMAQIAEHADEQQALSTVQKLSQAREELTATEVLYAEVFDEVDDALPSGVTIRGFTAQIASPDIAESGNNLGLDLNPLCVSSNATITILFVSENLGPAPSFVRDLEEVTGFECIVGTKIEDNDGAQAVTVQFALGGDALSGRFSEETAE